MAGDMALVGGGAPQPPNAKAAATTRHRMGFAIQQPIQACGGDSGASGAA